MKKQYIIPATECFHIETTHIIAESINIDSNETITDTGDYDFLGREDSRQGQQNLWNNEW